MIASRKLERSPEVFEFVNADDGYDQMHKLPSVMYKFSNVLIVDRFYCIHLISSQWW